MSIHHSPGLCGWDKLMENQGTFETVGIYKMCVGVFVRMCVCAYILVCSYKSKLHPFSWSVYCLKSEVIQSVAWLNWLEKKKIDCKLPWPVPHSAQQIQSVVPECKFPLQSVVGIYCVVGVLTVQKPCLPLHGHAAVWLPGWEMRPAGSSGVKTSHWFSDVSEGQISFLLLRFIRQLIKEDRSMEGDSTLTSKRGKGK